MRFQMRPIAPIEVSAVQLLVPARIGKQKGRKGDWLVTHTNGGIEIMKADLFSRSYEPMQENGSSGGGGAGKPSVGRRPGAQGRRPKAAAGNGTAPAGRRSKVTDATLRVIRKGWEAGDPVGAIAAAAKVSAPTVRKYAEDNGWERGERPNSAPSPSATAAPRSGEPKQLSGKVRCTECESWTSTDPCEFCGKKQRKNWG